MKTNKQIEIRTPNNHLLCFKARKNTDGTYTLCVKQGNKEDEFPLQMLLDALCAIKYGSN